MGPHGEKPNRIQSFTQETPTGWRVGLYLSKTQAFNAGLGNLPQVAHFHGEDIGKATVAADDWIKAKLPQHTL